MKSNTKSKDERLDFRVTAEFKALITHAAEVSGTSVSTLLIESARMRAMELLEQHDRIVLGNAARDQFLQMLENPPAPNAALRKAAKEYFS